MLSTWNKRERELIDANADALPPVALPPNAQGAYVGIKEQAASSLIDEVKKQGARTVPPREHGEREPVMGALMNGHD